jgi:outer membrane protein
MTKYILTLICAAVALSSMQAQAADLKVATIDLQKVFEDYYKTKEADARLKDQMEGFKSERDSRLEGYRSLVDQIKSLRDALNDPSLSEDAKKEKQLKYEEKFNEARQREQELRNFEQTTAKLLQDQSGRMRKTIIDEINEVVKAFCAGKYDLVMDKSGVTMNGTPSIMYSENLTDLTDAVVKQLNSKKPTE